MENKLILTKDLGRYNKLYKRQNKDMPIALHLLRENCLETLPHYTPPANCPGDAEPEKLFGLSGYWFDPKTDTVIIMKGETGPLDSWARKTAQIDYRGVYTKDTMLETRGEDLSNIQILRFEDWTAS
jgi:hypothetical protein